MKNDSTDTILDINELAIVLHKKSRTIKQMCYEGKIPHFIVGRKRLFKYSEILEWMDDECRAN